MQPITAATLLLFLTLGIASAARAQIETLTVAVDGLACPFCAYGIEKKLKRIQGVQQVTIDIQAGAVKLSAHQGQSINFRQVPLAVWDSGFTPRRIRLEAIGTVSGSEGRPLFLAVDNDQFLLTRVSRQIQNRLIAAADSGERIRITGIIRQAASGWTLSPHSLAEVTP